MENPLLFKYNMTPIPPPCEDLCPSTKNCSACRLHLRIYEFVHDLVRFRDEIIRAPPLAARYDCKPIATITQVVAIYVGRIIILENMFHPSEIKKVAQVSSEHAVRMQQIKDCIKTQYGNMINYLQKFNGNLETISTIERFVLFCETCLECLEGEALQQKLDEYQSIAIEVGSQIVPKTAYEKKILSELTCNGLLLVDPSVESTHSRKRVHRLFADE